MSSIIFARTRTDAKKVYFDALEVFENCRLIY